MKHQSTEARRSQPIRPANVNSKRLRDEASCSLLCAQAVYTSSYEEYNAKRG